MQKKNANLVQKVGGLAFIVGVIIAIIAGFFPIGTAITSVLIILGLITGFLNITGKEVNNFLFAALVLVVVASVGGNMIGQIDVVGKFLQNIFAAMLLFIVPAAIIVAFKAIYSLEKDA